MLSNLQSVVNLQFIDAGCYAEEVEYHTYSNKMCKLNNLIRKACGKLEPSINEFLAQSWIMRFVPRLLQSVQSDCMLRGL